MTCPPQETDTFCRTSLKIRLVLNPQYTYFRSEAIQILILGFFSMPTTRKQKKARKPRGLELLSDIENLDIMPGERHSGRDKNANSNSARRPASVTSDMFGNEENLYLNHTEMRSGFNAESGQNSTSPHSNAEINRLTSELNSRLSREMDVMMCSVNTQK